MSVALEDVCLEDRAVAHMSGFKTTLCQMPLFVACGRVAEKGFSERQTSSFWK